jgi:hypothetical protein
MGRGEGFDGAPGNESVDGGVGGDVLKNSGQDSALELFETDLGGFEKANAAGGFEREVVVVVTKARRRGVPFEALDIGIPEKFGEIDEDPVGERSWRFDGRDGPSSGGGDGLHLLGLSDPVSDGELTMMALPGAEEFRVVAQEMDDVFVAGARVCGKSLEIAAREGT